MEKKQEPKSENPSHYQIVILGELNESWSDWLGEMNILPGKTKKGESITILSGDIHDQAALRGTLNKIWDMQLTLVSVRRLEAISDDDFRTKEGVIS